MARRSNGPVYYIGLMTVLIIAFAVGIAAYNYIAPNLGLSAIDLGAGEKPDSTAGLVSVTKPLTISLRDAQSGSALPGAVVVMYDLSLRSLELLTIQSTGTATTAVPYSSGSTLILQKTASNYVTEYSQRTVPMLPKVDAVSLSANMIAESMTKKPTIVIGVTDRNGNVINNGSTFNMSGLSSAQFTVSIINTQDNSGWKTSYDPFNKVNLGLAAVTVPSDKVVLAGTGTLINRGVVSHLITQIPDGQITRSVIGSQVTGGAYTYTFTVNRGTLASGANATIAIAVQGYFDQGYYSSYGMGGPMVETLASFSFTIMG